MAFLPTTKKEIEQLGWDVPDFVLVTGDAYVDHPTFGVAIISRLLESYGYKISILAQPDWRTDKIWTAEIRIYGHCGQYRFHGCPLYRCQKKTQRRRLFPRRKGRKTS